MIKKISYSLFSNNPRYTVNALVNSDLCLKYYPDWKCKIYYDNTVSIKIIQLLSEKQNVEIEKVDGYGHSRRMWRFFGYDDSDIVICRDIDSHINEREVSAVNDWLNTNKNLHIMRDHPNHNNRLQAGMFGLKKNNKLINIKNLCNEYIKKNQDKYSMDESFLRDEIYELYLNDMVVHDSQNRHNDKTHEWKIPIEYTDQHGQFIGRDQYPPSSNIELFKKYESLIK